MHRCPDCGESFDSIRGLNAHLDTCAAGRAKWEVPGMRDLTDEERAKLDALDARLAAGEDTDAVLAAAIATEVRDMARAEGLSLDHISDAAIYAKAERLALLVQAGVITYLQLCRVMAEWTAEVGKGG